MGEGIIPRILNHGTGWMWAVRFTPLSMYQRQSILYLLYGTLGGPQRWFRHSVLLPGLEPRFSCCRPYPGHYTGKSPVSFIYLLHIFQRLI